MYQSRNCDTHKPVSLCEKAESRHSFQSRSSPMSYQCYQTFLMTIISRLCSPAHYGHLYSRAIGVHIVMSLTRTQTKNISKRAARSDSVCYYSVFQNIHFSSLEILRKMSQKECMGRGQKSRKSAMFFKHLLLWHTLL